MDLGVAVVSYNTRDLTAACLGALFASLEQSALDARVWVVDNASSDGSAAMVAERYPQAVLIASDENLGFAGGTNLAIEAMRDEPGGLPRHVLLLNPDTVVEPDAVPRMVSYLDANPHVGVVGAQLLYPDGSFQHGAFRFPTLPMILFDFWIINHRLINSRLNGRYPRRLYEAGQPFPIDHPLGAALMIRREALEQVGLLDTGYFMYCEEVDWCMRIKAAGWAVYCVPRARIVHHAGGSTRQFRDRMFIALWRSRFRLFDRHYGRVYRTLARVIVRAGLRRDLARLRREVARGLVSPDEAERRAAAYHTVMEM
ncbi:MAG TPA: glycosyltransferase family 2 protein [Chloroflexi bacterium]|jgi:N-acetylglucosaminyl-diphospho-decaprenol L-rhamnosyltransferase|nr:glycosyltransferase family 2 protein [Chloroflexota bacterium]